ncbi:MAG: PorT family protein [Cytophagales bacterium]|nr:MAG: PorT family protein [Cytophagales bacterium]
MIAIPKNALTIMFLFGTLLTQTPVKAQSNNSGLRLGVRAGGSTVLPLEAVDNATYYPTAALNGGLVANLGRGRFTIQPEINFSQRSIRADYNAQGVSLSARVLTNRLEVPILIKYNFRGPDDDRSGLFLTAGSYATYVLREQYKAKILSYGNLSTSLQAIADAVVNSLDGSKATFDGSKGRVSYGVAGGLGYGFNTQAGQITLEGRALYQLGDNTPENFTDPSGVGIASNIRDTKYMLLQLTIGYLIPVGGR